MARKTSGGGTRNARKGKDAPVEDAEIVGETEAGSPPDHAGDASGGEGGPAALGGAEDGMADGMADGDDPTPTGTSSVEARPGDGEDGDGGRTAQTHPGAEGTSEVEAPTPADDVEAAADPSIGLGDRPAPDPLGDAWETVPGALTPPEAGHPEAVEGVRIGDGGLAAPSGDLPRDPVGDPSEPASGTDIVPAASVEMVAPAGPAPQPEPDEPSAADTPEVVVTPPPDAADAVGEPRHAAFGTEETGTEKGTAAETATGAAAGAALGGAAHSGRGTPPDLDPPHAAPSSVNPSTGSAAGRDGPSSREAAGGGGFVPLLLGGLLAGLIGLGAGWLLFGDGADSGGLEEEVAALRSQVEGLTGAPDFSPLNARIDEVAAGIPTLTEVEERLGAIETALAAPEDMPADDPLAGRLEEVEGRFIEVDSLAGAVGELREQFATLAAGLADAGEGTAASNAGREALGQEITSAARRLDALATEVGTLSEGFAALREASAGLDGLGARLDEVAAGADATRGDLDALLTERDRLVAEAESAASEARAEAALERLRAAVDAGAPYREPLTAFEEASGETVPEALSAAAEEGVPSLAQLQDAWGQAARDALDEAPAEPGPGGFLRAQLGIRSLTEREGDSADAILSRAEADLRGGDLDGTLSEIEGLSESPRAALDPWVAEAEARLAVTEALAALDTSGSVAPSGTGAEAATGTNPEQPAPTEDAGSPADAPAASITSDSE